MLELKIACTLEEKEQLIYVLSHGDQCPFASTHPHVCMESNCEPCVTNGIEWEIMKEGVQSE